MSFVEDVNIQWQDTGNIDAFGRARVSQVTTQLDVKQLYDSRPILLDGETIGTGTRTYNAGEASTTLDVSANLDLAMTQSKQRFNYQSGKSQLMFWTFYGFDNEADTIKRVGYFSSSTGTPFSSNLDGIFLQSDGTNISVNTYRRGLATSSVNRSAWDDPLDGTGNSGITHNFDNNTILSIDFEWLGVGRVRYYLVKDGSFVLFHQTDFTGSIKVYMKSPNQPLRWEVRSSAITGGTGFTYVCASVNSEGSMNRVGKEGGADDNGTHLNANSTGSWYFAIGLKLKSTTLDSVIDIVSGSLLSITNDKFLFRVLYNPTYNGTVTYTAITDYAVSFGLGATTNDITADGTILSTGNGTDNASQDFNISSAIKLGAAIDGTLDEIVIAVKPLTSNLDIHRGINFLEL